MAQFIVSLSYKNMEEGKMGYKRWSKNMSFGEMALTRTLEKNRSLKTMERINKIINWERVKVRLMDYYTIGRK